MGSRKRRRLCWRACPLMCLKVCEVEQVRACRPTGAMAAVPRSLASRSSHDAKLSINRRPNRDAARCAVRSANDPAVNKSGLNGLTTGGTSALDTGTFTVSAVQPIQYTVQEVSGLLNPANEVQSYLVSCCACDAGRDMRQCNKHARVLRLLSLSFAALPGSMCAHCPTCLNSMRLISDLLATDTTLWGCSRVAPSQARSVRGQWQWRHHHEAPCHR